ncbi:hypothetical protein TH61_12865 [Rufibacter sp. DG15C]|uniref:hypothetical protein n=1 Tax=Rufibacter sp. DG15C TaxID=1379909 RepID=UPI00078B8B38|nr:hypothetical protein [Rufibacter sp. DG15C]AMM51892.1 hypothetical protein TH61_12865 [Rufibacter sp. DG15C]
MAKESRILKALYTLATGHGNPLEARINPVEISKQTPGLSLGEVEQEIRDLDLKKWVVMERSDTLDMYCRFTPVGLQEAEKYAS